MTIALLCPTRGRPEQLKRMIKSAQATSTLRNVNFYIATTMGVDEPLYQLAMPDGMPTAFKWNLLAEEALKNPDNNLFMLASDDIVFSTPLWDKALLDHCNALKNKIHVYHLRDNRNPDGIPHPIVSREYIESMGYFLPPLFLHWFVDTWTVEIAKANNCFTHLKDYELQHIKSSDQGGGDETHNRIRSMGWRERDAWVNEKCQHFFESEKARLAKAMAV